MSFQLEEFQGRFRMTDGFELFYRRWLGTGEAKKVIIGHHGIGLNSEYLRLIGQDLAREGYAFYATDLRGFGNSKEEGLPIGDVRDFKRQLQDLDEVVRQVHKAHPGKRLFMLGHSLGGSYTLWYAAHHSETLDGLILLAPAIISTTTIPRKDLLLFLFALPFSPGKQLDFASLWIKEVRRSGELRSQTEDPLVAKGLSVRFLNGVRSVVGLKNSAQNARKIEEATLVLQGDADNVNVPDGARKLMEDLATKDKTLKTFPAADHFFYQTIATKPSARYDRAKQVKVTGAIADWLEAH
jgi:alpha-beta hydrolase superfamily lysophospholipase